MHSGQTNGQVLADGFFHKKLADETHGKRDRTCANDK